MIEIQLKNIADRLGKSITDIARETGLNRNTITDLYHQKVDGLKFATIDALCDTYGLTLEDLVIRTQNRIGGGTSTKMARITRPATPLFAWTWLQGLHRPTSLISEEGIGSLYGFFARGEAEFYFNRTEVNRLARHLYDQYGHSDLDDVQVAFYGIRDQLQASIIALAAQPIKQFTTADLLKTFARLYDLYSDFWKFSAWIDVFDFGIRDEILEQIQRAHQLSPVDIALLTASGESTHSVIRRLALLKLAELFVHQKSSLKLQSFVIEHRSAAHFLAEYPFITPKILTKHIELYAKNAPYLTQEKSALINLARSHTKALKETLRRHRMRVNPLAFFATLATWRDERDEMNWYAEFQLQHLLDTIADRLHILPSLTPYLTPPELERAQSGVVSEQTLEERRTQGMLITLEHGAIKTYEGSYAISVQDDLVSRFMSQLSYADIS